MPVGLLLIQIRLPGCSSLKEKRSRIKPLLVRLHREFNVSTAEMDQQDVWQNAVIGCALVSNNAQQVQRALRPVLDWVEQSWPDVEVVDDQIDILG